MNGGSDRDGFHSVNATKLLVLLIPIADNSVSMLTSDNKKLRNLLICLPNNSKIQIMGGIEEIMKERGTWT